MSDRRYHGTNADVSACSIARHTSGSVLTTAGEPHLAGGRIRLEGGQIHPPPPCECRHGTTTVPPRCRTTTTAQLHHHHVGTPDSASGRPNLAARAPDLVTGAAAVAVGPMTSKSSRPPPKVARTVAGSCNHGRARHGHSTSAAGSPRHATSSHTHTPPSVPWPPPSPLPHEEPGPPGREASPPPSRKAARASQLPSPVVARGKNRERRGEEVGGA